MHQTKQEIFVPTGMVLLRKRRSEHVRNLIVEWTCVDGFSAKNGGKKRVEKDTVSDATQMKVNKKNDLTWGDRGEREGR